MPFAGVVALLALSCLAHRFCTLLPGCILHARACLMPRCLVFWPQPFGSSAAVFRGAVMAPKRRRANPQGHNADAGASAPAADLLQTPKTVEIVTHERPTSPKQLQSSQASYASLTGWKWTSTGALSWTSRAERAEQQVRLHPGTLARGWPADSASLHAAGPLCLVWRDGHLMVRPL